MTTTDAHSLLAGPREDFVCLTVREQHSFFADDGFLWIPDALSPEQVARIVDEMGGNAAPNRLEFDEHWPGGTLAEIITCPAVMGAVRAYYGDDIRFFKGVFATWIQQSDENLARGRQILHRDYTGFEPPEDAAQHAGVVVQRRLLFHRPGRSTRGRCGSFPEATASPTCGTAARWRRMPPRRAWCLRSAGDAVLFHCRTIHAGGVMRSRRPRPSAFLSYRPGWAAPLSTGRRVAGARHAWRLARAAKAARGSERRPAGRSGGHHQSRLTPAPDLAGSPSRRRCGRTVELPVEQVAEDHVRLRLDLGLLV